MGKLVLDVGAFQCCKCGHIEKIKQSGIFVKAPVKCEECGHGNFKYVPELSTLITATLKTEDEIRANLQDIEASVYAGHTMMDDHMKGYVEALKWVLGNYRTTRSLRSCQK